MHQARTCVCGNVAAVEHNDFAFQERVFEFQVFQRRAGGFGEHRAACTSVTRQCAFRQIFGQHQFAFGRVNQLIHYIRAGGNGLAGRQSPRRGGPDNGEGFAGNFGQAECFGQSGIVFEQILHVDGGRYFVFVFHFGFGQRRTAIQAELHGFGAAVQITRFIDFAECAHGVRLGFEIHGSIRLVPIAHHAQPHEVGFLAGDLFGGIFAA